MEPVSNSEVKLVERIGIILLAIKKFFITIVQVLIALILLVVIGLASVKGVELYENSLVQFKADMLLLQKE